ncbi:hypothetical protein ACLQ3H_07320 [Micromonospora saelicesensis]|uniref:hypothetical protein n=1 Tax=Micromonospora saelicesensis TaxID=285676 RepID=UPI003CEC54DC
MALTVEPTSGRRSSGRGAAAVEVVANGVPHPLGAAPQGAVVEVVAAEPYEEVQVWASTEDGRRYQIPWAPGAVLLD